MMEKGQEEVPDLDLVLEGMKKNNEALKKYIKEGSRKHSGSSNSSLELEETTSTDKKEELIEEEKAKDIDADLKIFSREAPRFKLIPDPETRGSEDSFQRHIKEAFEKVLPAEMVDSLTTRKCGLCNEQFEELKWAHRHYTGYNHKGAIKSFIRGTFQIHPPYFKMVWEAINSKHPEGVTDIQIFVYVMMKFNVGEDIKKIEQFIQYGIERLVVNDYISKDENVFRVVDASRALDIKVGAARVPTSKVSSTKDSKKDFELKVLDEFQDDLPADMVKTLKPDYCGLCHFEIKENAWELHYTGNSHRRTVELYKTGQYLGHPSYSKMVEQYIANKNPTTISEKDIVKFVMKNFKVEADEVKVHAKVQKALKSILEKPFSSSDDRSHYREPDTMSHYRKSRQRERNESVRRDSFSARPNRPQTGYERHNSRYNRPYTPGRSRTRSRSRDRFSSPAQPVNYQQHQEKLYPFPGSVERRAASGSGSGFRDRRRERETRGDYRR